MYDLDEPVGHVRRRDRRDRWRSGSPGCSARRPPRSSPPARWPSRWRCAAGRAVPATRRWPCTRWPTPRCTSGDALCAVSGLRTVHLTSEPRLPTADEVRDFEEPFGTLMLELPLRDAGFVLPSWDELTEVVEAARERDAVVHFDGARLWECTTHFGRPLAEIAAPRGQRLRVVLQVARRAAAARRSRARGRSSRRRRPGGTGTAARSSSSSRRRCRRWSAWSGSCRGCRSTWPTRAWSPRRCARGSRRRACRGSRPPGGAAHAPVPGLAAVRRRGADGGGGAAGRGDEDVRCSARWSAAGPGLGGHGGDGGRAAGLEWTAEDVADGGGGLRGAVARLSRLNSWSRYVTGAGPVSRTGCASPRPLPAAAASGTRPPCSA